MPVLEPFLPRTRSGRALLVTGLYAALALLALYAPISYDAPFAHTFGTPDLAREAMVGFARLLFWPVVAVLAAHAVGPWAQRLLRRSGGSE
jgi:hypothetical protein